ncbi:hypothetical protein BDV98DRAFT_570987 [Pterulicium gracile]|uniref:Alcohol dehydrogenase-like C-terminal domain-containing protein n=1 Tax=Pterulicium gracile TaxID=1884261 RepID=A0A5C3QCJ1_9AGAR|nr:hypothetical protein BDV98DRAFT_570987 [Pterula gracilis]
MTKPQSGTWSTAKNVGEGDVLKVPRPKEGEGLTDVHLATLTVNPPTAYNVLRDFVDLEEGDWVVQNGANSAVGQAVIQVAAARGIKTLNFVRNRDNLSELVKWLEGLGATKVLTYDDLSDKSVRDKIKEWTRGKGIKLGLNCVGGKETSLMARLMGKDAHLVSYGAMSKQPLSFPTSLFIFQNLTSHGFWQARWYQANSREKRQELVNALIDLAREGKLKAPESEILTLEADKSDAAIEKEVREIVKKVSAGRYGKKVLLSIETHESQHGS